MYGKLFESFWDSSLNQKEAYPTRLAFQFLFTTMNQDGFAHCPSASVLARRVNITLEEAEEAIRVLSAPDPDSTNPEHEGRRIEQVPGGFLVLNGVYYRELRNLQDEREKVRIRVRKYRERKKKECNSYIALQNVTSVYASVSDSLSKEGKKSVKGKETYFQDSPVAKFEDFRAGLSDWSEEKVRHYFELFSLHEKYKYIDWCKAARRWDIKTPFIEKRELKSIKDIWEKKNYPIPGTYAGKSDYEPSPEEAKAILEQIKKGVKQK